MAKNGNLEFNTGDHILFILKGSRDEEDDSDKFSHWMDFEETPKRQAKALRAAAAWLEAHAGDDIEVEID